jgi:hypothetical protein
LETTLEAADRLVERRVVEWTLLRTHMRDNKQDESKRLEMTHRLDVLQQHAQFDEQRRRQRSLDMEVPEETAERLLVDT